MGQRPLRDFLFGFAPPSAKNHGQPPRDRPYRSPIPDPRPSRGTKPFTRKPFTPESTVAETAIATLSLLEICRDLDSPPRFFHAASSEIFGVLDHFPQTEETPYRPVNPYGCAKAFAANLCHVYRESHGMFVVNGILYNHESPRRGESFVTRKITSTVARIAKGSQEVLELGNLDSERDWGWAPEFGDAIWRTLKQENPTDYLLATGTSTTVREFATAAFKEAGIELDLTGTRENEQGVCAKPASSTSV